MFRRGIETKRLLRWGLYLILGLILAQTAWVLTLGARARGDYSAVVVFLFGATAVAATIYLERRCRGKKFHFYHPWKIPDVTTRRFLWLIAGFDALVTLTIYWVVLMIAPGPFTRSLDTAFVAPMAGALLFLTLPYGYWLMRRLYQPAPVGETTGDQRPLLRYMGYSQPPWRERLLATLLIGALILVLMLSIRWLIG